MSIDLKKQTPSGLKNLAANSQRLGNTEMARAVVQEMDERGMATRRDVLEPRSRGQGNGTLYAGCS
jgi:hypothetical protein